jgi:hypothetical protein
VRALAALGLLVAGAVTGVAAVAVHTIGWGLLLGLAATFASALALPPGWWTRLPLAAGWVGVVGWLSVPRAEGDYLVGSDAAGYGLLVAGLVLLVLAVATLPKPRRSAPPHE